MVVLLPNQGSSIDEMMKKVDVKSLAELRGKMDECMVDLKLPRFSTELSLPLNGIISKLGARFDVWRKCQLLEFCNWQSVYFQDAAEGEDRGE